LVESAARVAGLGYWSWTFPTGELLLSAQAQNIFGYREGSFDGSFASWLGCIDPADLQAMQDVEDQVRRGQRTFSVEYRFITPDGQVRRLKSDGEIVSLDDSGDPLQLAGTVIELGETQGEQEHPRRSPIEAAPADAQASYEYSWEQDANYRFTRMGESRQMPIAAAASAIGQCRWELPHAVPLRSSWRPHIEALERHEPFRGFEFRIGNGPDASYVSSSGDPVFDATGAFAGYRGTALDITRRVKAELRAARARVLLEQASHLGQLGAWYLRLPGMEVEWSHQTRRIFGHGRNAGLSWEEAIGHLEEPYRTELRRAVADSVARQTAFSLEARAVSAHGRTLWLRIIGEPEPAITGPPRRVIGAIQDISARKDAAGRLQELNDRLSTTLESITQGFYELDRQWRFTYVNHEMERVTQRSRSELLGRSITELFPWFAGSRFYKEFESALADGRTAHLEAFLAELGVWVEVYAYPSSQGLAVYFQDVTERKNAEEALRVSEERHRLLFEVSLDALFQVEQASGRIVSANPAACRMFGMTEAQLRELDREDLVAPEEQRLQRVLEEGRGQLTLVRADGTRFEAELSGVLFTASDGTTYASVVVRDMSDVLKYQAEILALNESLARKVRERTAELEAANAELRAFAHSLAHDLRTPIAAVAAFGQVLEERLEPAAQRERKYVARIREAAQQLDEYVEALLSQARISQVSLQLARVDLSATVQGILADLRLREPDRDVVTQVQPEIMVSGDGTLLRMALENLLGNAWKFTRERPRAEIRFSATVDAQQTTTFCVSDNGAGFDMQYAHKLFGTFQRLHTQAEFPGTGIGLANVQRIISRHGGRIWAVGEPGAGASFYFTLEQGGRERQPTEHSPA
jgi:PAS domain S-box-containing protein